MVQPAQEKMWEDCEKFWNVAVWERVQDCKHRRGWCTEVIIKLRNRLLAKKAQNFPRTVLDYFKREKRTSTTVVANIDLLEKLFWRLLCFIWYWKYTVLANAWGWRPENHTYVGIVLYNRRCQNFTETIWWTDHEMIVPRYKDGGCYKHIAVF